ncbi:MAG: hypothetical protein JSV21_04365 [Nitrospirota bacterium]|nr:MAG: hypothetical protein JSV21_04365 [Nitrospirota bacterium]
MKRTMIQIFITVSVLVLMLPIAAFALYKPSRVLIPSAFGMHCGPSGICVDDAGRLAEAEALYHEASRYIADTYDLDITDATVIFCSTERCRDTFGCGQKAGYALGSYGVVIAPRGWAPHYVAHELIHHWQTSTFGDHILLTGDTWVVEGMAYLLSGDPREKLDEPFDSYRDEFRKWYAVRKGETLERSLRKVL